MTALCPVKPATLFEVPEILEKGAGLNGESVRVMGRLLEYDEETNSVRVGDQGATMTVDVRNIMGVPLQENSLYQFLGEIDCYLDNQPVLKARVVRNVDGLDEALYKEALKERRVFENQRF